MIGSVPRPIEPLAALASLFLAAYLVAYLVLGGVVAARLWAQGEHPTPEHLAYHALLEGLGVADHHHAPGDSSGRARDLSQLAPLLVPGAPALVSSSDGVSAWPLTAQHLAGAVLFVLAAAWVARLVRADELRPCTPFVSVPDPPPRSAR